jgi:tRNA pseudouridine55 synthase
LVVDKPGGLTSRAALDRAQRWFPRRTRLGHTGTLDPLATGVLVLCIGSATRLTEFVQDMPKTYQADFLLGSRSDTDDADGTVTPVPGAQPPERDKLIAQLQAFVGEIQQVPPVFSAAKVTGRRAYDLARAGHEVPLAPRPVRVYGIDVRHYAYPRLAVEVRCGKGTYIRSLARDLGERLGCGALVQTLRRVRVGPFSVTAAVNLETDAATARGKLLPASAAVADLAQLVLGPDDIKRLRQGQGVPLPARDLPAGAQAGTAAVAVFDGAGELVAVGRVDPKKRLLLPEKVLPGPI